MSRHNITENTALLSVFSLISHTSTSPTTDHWSWSTSTIQHFLRALLALQSYEWWDGTEQSAQQSEQCRCIQNYATIRNTSLAVLLAVDLHSPQIVWYVQHCRAGSRRGKYLRKENISQIAFTSSPSLSRLETCLAVNHHMVGEALTESLQQAAEPSLSTHFCCCPLQHYTVIFNTSNMVLCKGFKELFIPFLERFIKVWPSV